MKYFPHPPDYGKSSFLKTTFQALEVFAFRRTQTRFAQTVLRVISLANTSAFPG